jgi:hypothetical protein
MSRKPKTRLRILYQASINDLNLDWGAFFGMSYRPPEIRIGYMDLNPFGPQRLCYIVKILTEGTFSTALSSQASLLQLAVKSLRDINVTLL